MRYLLLLYLLLAVSRLHAQPDTTCVVKKWTILPHISIRALEAVNDSTAWFAANHGVWGYTDDGGKTWHTDSIKADSVYPEFRSMAVLNDSTVLLLSIASPALLFKTTNKGKTWTLIGKREEKDVFFDSMHFSKDLERTYEIGDPINNYFQLSYTTSSSPVWRRKKDNHIKAETGESLFASSNTCLDTYKKNIWFATGGKVARVFHGNGIADYFHPYNTPISQGAKMTGIFSIDFINDSTGVIAGGNYEKTDTSVVGLAMTRDGGKNWEVIKPRKPFFGSCVQFRREGEFFVTGHDGTYLCRYTKNQIKEIKDQSGTALKFHTLRFSPSGNMLWIAGGGGRIGFIKFAP